MQPLGLVLPQQWGNGKRGAAQRDPSDCWNYRYPTETLMPCVSPSQEAVHQDLPACGLHPKTLDQLSQSPTLGKSSIRLLEMKDYAYTWKA